MVDDRQTRTDVPAADLLMADLVVEIHGLVKRYGARIVAVDGLDLQIRSGEVYGLLGPNGAGKTTTIRVLLGLVRPTSGTIRVLGKPPGDRSGLRRTGATGETAFYPFLAGRDNLRAAARRARVPEARVGMVLDRVALGSRAGDPVGTYSLGMKQRLGVAVALLKDPDLLILDEPSNGLDPQGQREMRRLIRDLARDGRTILLSSHDMSEVEALCGRVGVLSGGRLVAEDSPVELRGAPRLRVRAEPAPLSVAAAAGLPGVRSAELREGVLSLAMADSGAAAAAAVNSELVGAGFAVSEVRTERLPLQDAFLELTGGRTGGADSVRSPQGRRRRRAGSHRS